MEAKYRHASSEEIMRIKSIKPQLARLIALSLSNSDWRRKWEIYRIFASLANCESVTATQNLFDSLDPFSLWNHFDKSHFKTGRNFPEKLFNVYLCKQSYISIPFFSFELQNHD